MSPISQEAARVLTDSPVPKRPLPFTCAICKHLGPDCLVLFPYQEHALAMGDTVHRKCAYECSPEVQVSDHGL